MSHADRRLSYVRGLRAKADRLTCAHEAKQWEHVCTLAAKIALHEGPLPDRHRVVQDVHGAGAAAEAWLKAIDEGLYEDSRPPPGRFCAPASALLVALLEHANTCAPSSSPPLCPKGALIDAAAALCEQEFHSLDAQLAQPGLRCAGLQHLSTLITMGFVKQRTRKAASPSGIVYELLPAGRARAERLVAEGEIGAPEPLRHSRRPAQGERGIVYLLVDEREGGGPAQAGMADICDALARGGTRFETRRLPTGHGDYEWLLVDGPPRPAERRLPLIIERKSCLDVSASIKDGRWSRQCRAMEARNLSEFDSKAEIEYILEGDVRSTLHSCDRCSVHTCHRCTGEGEGQISGAAGLGEGRSGVGVRGGISGAGAGDGALAAAGGAGVGTAAGDPGVGGCPRDGWPLLSVVEAEIRKLGQLKKLTRTAGVAATAVYLSAEQRRLQEKYKTAGDDENKNARGDNNKTAAGVEYKTAVGPAPCSPADSSARAMGAASVIDLTSGGSREQRSPEAALTYTAGGDSADQPHAYTEGGYSRGGERTYTEGGEDPLTQSMDCFPHAADAPPPSCIGAGPSPGGIGASPAPHPPRRAQRALDESFNAVKPRQQGSGAASSDESRAADSISAARSTFSSGAIYGLDAIPGSAAAAPLGAKGGVPKASSPKAGAQAKPPRRPTGHKAAPPGRPPSIPTDQPFPRDQTANFAFLVAMDRAERQAAGASHAQAAGRAGHGHGEAAAAGGAQGAQAGVAGAAAAGGAGQLAGGGIAGQAAATGTAASEFTKETLMRMADDKTQGVLCTTDVFDKNAGRGGPYAYTGWSNIHKGLIKRPVPWVGLVREYTSRREGKATTVYALTEAGRVAAYRLHREAERAGWCTCGLVQPAGCCGGELGVRGERLPALRHMMTPEGFAAREEWEGQVVEWERREAEHQNAIEVWKRGQGQPSANTSGRAGANTAGGAGAGGLGTIRGAFAGAAACFKAETQRGAGIAGGEEWAGDSDGGLSPQAKRLPRDRDGAGPSSARPGLPSLRQIPLSDALRRQRQAANQSSLLPIAQPTSHSLGRADAAIHPWDLLVGNRVESRATPRPPRGQARASDGRWGDGCGSPQGTSRRGQGASELYTGNGSQGGQGASDSHLADGSPSPNGGSQTEDDGYDSDPLAGLLARAASSRAGEAARAAAGVGAASPGLSVGAPAAAKGAAKGVAAGAPAAAKGVASGANAGTAATGVAKGAARAAAAAPSPPMEARWQSEEDSLSEEPDLVSNLVACGFDEAEARRALQRCHGSPRARLNAAVDLLLGRGGAPAVEAAGMGGRGPVRSPSKRERE